MATSKRRSKSSARLENALRKTAGEARQTAEALAQRAKANLKKTGAVHKSADQVHESIEPVRQETRDARTEAAKGQKAEARGRFPIVGLGASAGGLEAMIQLLRHLPGNTGMAFVLVQHLDPTHESALTALLGRATGMPATEARNNLKLEANHLYVIPPNKMMGISGRRLKLTPRKNANETRAPIDYFLQSLAEEEGNAAIGVILSGNGSDGTAGLRAVKAAGGITFAQEERTAKYPAMPGSAITAGCVDFILAPEKIGRELARISGHPYIVPDREGEDRPAAVEDKVFAEILSLLRQRLMVDFTHYKHATLQRRIQRRMVLHKFEKLEDYAHFLRGHSGETKELFNDILIHVTGFFRDATVFPALKKRAFSRMIKGKAPDHPIRVWVAGCSSGEEVYSIAISLLEFLQDRKLHCPLQIFGTDINDVALDKARAGIYPEAIQEDISAERMRRFFTRIEGGFRINKSVREICIFARQNVVADPPFSNLDLISCRNVLIYLGQPLQRKIFPLFHYALRPSGLLLLGASETIGRFADLFSLVDKKIKLYLKKGTHTRPTVTFGPPFAVMEFDKRPELKSDELAVHVGDVQKQADRILLTHFSPAGVVINRSLEVLQFRGRTSDYLEHAHGEASLNLLKMAREGLAVDLRAATTQSFKQNARVRREHVRVRKNGHHAEITIEVVPFQVPPSRERYYLVLFEPSSRPLTESGQKREHGRRERARQGAETTELMHLREELASTRESLQAIIEEQEATNEELRSANEEIMSSNEELQSTNEELETAKEELQSTNEELTTLNEELESRNLEAELINNDLHNLLASVNIPVLILDPDLRIRRFTAVAERMFNLIPSDVGRPITDIALKIEVPNFPRLVLEVIDSLATRELEACDKEHHWWSVRIRPYKTTENKIDGAVVAFVDIDVLKHTAEVISQSRDLAEAIVNTVRHPLVVLDQELNVNSVNEAFRHTFKVSVQETLNRRIYDLGNGQWDIPRLRTLLEEILPKNTHFNDFEVSHRFPSIGLKTMRLNARRIEFDNSRQQLILLAIEELTKEPPPPPP
jgi:two-component system CheB/CheR fusion protein